MKTELQRIGSYELRQRLNRDSVGEMWRAYDTTGQRIVTLKLYPTHLPGDPELLAHYIHTVEQVAALHHPNIVSIHDVQVLAPRSSDSTLSLICLVMEDVERETLADYIGRTAALRKIPPSTDIVPLFSSIAQAVDYAHRHGIIHGNLKPATILLNQSLEAPGGIGTPLLTDFAQTSPFPQGPGTSIPFYLAPEQIKGAPAEERSDIYALGVLLYELYTGIPPFRGNRPIAVMMQHVNALPTPPDLVNPGISPSVTQVILCCLAKEPQERFPNASTLAAALAISLHLEVPDDLHRSAVLADKPRSSVAPQGTPSDSFTAAHVQRATSLVANTPTRGPRHAQMGSAWPNAAKRKRRNNPLTITAVIVLALLFVAIFGTLLLLAQREAVPSIQETGQVFFINSGQLDESSTQGINDELQVELSNIPDPATGKSYYGWLLGDISQTEAASIFIGRIPVAHGIVHFLYAGNRQHVNLLGLASRFLITEDDAHTPSSNPLLDQSTWRYYAAIPQTPNPTDKLHFSMLDHLRHLLVESPELAVRGLHGGLAFWFVRNAAALSNVASSLADDWQKKDANALHTQIIRILDYLDGTSFVTADVPPGTPMLAEAQLAQVALLGPAPQGADPPGYVYQNEAPPGYVYLVQMHMDGAILSPQATPKQHQLAIHINGGIDTVRRLFTQVYQDARQLVHLTDAQLLQPSALTLLNDMATQAQDAYTGQLNPSSGTSQGGVQWIYDNLQRLASFEVALYTAP